MKKYIQNREYVISEFLNNVRIEYRENKELIDAATDLTVGLQVAPCNNISEKFVNNLRGFMIYAGMTNLDRQKTLATIYHDLGEFIKNRNESWFSPRCSGYSEYLLHI